MTRWTSEVQQNNVPVFRVGRDGARLVAEWLETARFSCDRDGERVEFVSMPGADAATLAKIRKSAVPALLGHLRGFSTLHAAAAALDGGAIACVGPSGAGKSTLAQHLVRCVGWRFLSDDLLRVDVETSTVHALPMAESSWIRVNGHRAPVEPVRRAAQPTPLVAIVELSFDDVANPSLEPLTGSAALVTVSNAFVRFVVDEPEMHRRDLDCIGRLIQAVPVFRLHRPRDLAQLDACASLLPLVQGRHE